MNINSKKKIYIFLLLHRHPFLIINLPIRNLLYMHVKIWLSPSPFLACESFPYSKRDFFLSFIATRFLMPPSECGHAFLPFPCSAMGKGCGEMAPRTLIENARVAKKDDKRDLAKPITEISLERDRTKRHIFSHE